MNLDPVSTEVSQVPGTTAVSPVSRSVRARQLGWTWELVSARTGMEVGALETRLVLGKA